MSLSTKVLVAGATGVAALALVGVGVGASMNDQATATTSMATGHVRIAASALLGHGAYLSDGQPGLVSASSQPDATTGLTNAAANSVAYGAVNNVGSNFSEILGIQVKDLGSLPLKTLTVAESQPTGSSSVLAGDTHLKLTVVSNELSMANPGVTTLYDGTLSSFSASGYAIPSTVIASLKRANNKSATVTAVLTPNGGSYGNADEDQTLSPVFTFTGSDV
jgi:hypothetical protein